VRPVTAEPAEFAEEPRELAEAFALAVTVLTVTSPPKIEIDDTSAEALEVAEEPGVAKAPEVTEPARKTDPSAGYANEPPTPTASGGAETLAAEPPLCPGTATCTAKARAEVAPFSADAAPRERSRRASASVTGISRATAIIIRHGSDAGQPGVPCITDTTTSVVEIENHFQ
jgi:hypothetical protein